MARIFISYRREDSDIWVGRLASELRNYLPSDQVFQDIASIDPGVDFVEALDKALATAAVMLAVIGPRWLSATDKQRRRRLDLPGDFVRQEIAESLRRPGVRVFPLLVNGAEMPSEEELPDPLKPLHRRQAFELTVRHWDNDVAQLVQTLKRVQTEDEAKRREAEEDAAKEEAKRVAAEERARKEADEEARRQADEEDRRRPGEEARRKAAEEAQRKAAEEAHRKAEDGGRRRVKEEARRKAEEEEARRKSAEEARRKTEEEAQRNAAEEEARKAVVPPPGESHPPAGAPRKLLAIAGVLAVAVALVVFFNSGRRPEAPASAPQPAAALAPAPEAMQAKPTVQKAEPLPSAETSFKAGATFRDCQQCPEMVVIPAGKFTMGSPESEKGRSPDEGPQHTVTIARPFALSKFEVTFDEWDACVAAGGCARKPEDEGWGRRQRPVINVSWDDAQAYIAWLSKRTGKRYRLLSEAEWEYAARGGTTTRYPWGDEPGTNRANFRDSGKTAPVGSFDPNKFGLHDMIGNVWEWVQDCWNDSYKGAPDDGSAWGTGNCGLRVLRGGSWNDAPEDARGATRLRSGPTYRFNFIFGFRVARTL